MKLIRKATTLAAQAIVLLHVISVSAPACSQEFRRLFSDRVNSSPTIYQGHSAGGNSITLSLQFQSIAAVPIVINRVADVRSLDPEDVGFADISPDNDNAARSAVKALYPDYDFFSSSGWVTANPTRKIWQTELVFESPFPILINPGDYLAFTRISRNNLNGPVFGPITATSMTPSRIEAIGEIIVAVDFDWRYVPEPACGSLVGVAILGIVTLTRRRMR